MSRAAASILPVGWALLPVLAVVTGKSAYLFAGDGQECPSYGGAIGSMRMIHRHATRLLAKTLLVGIAALFAWNCQELLAQSNAARPNILIIFTDDQGYGDLACYGSETNQTPRMDQLAKEGTRFTNFYAQHVCGPSRSALLTGRYPLRSKGWGMSASEVTFAELMKQVGYQTACIGKGEGDTAS